MKYAFIVTLDIPDRLKRNEVANYVADAVATMMGCYHPTSRILQTTRIHVRDDVTKTVIDRDIGYTFYDPLYED